MEILTKGVQRFGERSTDSLRKSKAGAEIWNPKPESRGSPMAQEEKCNQKRSSWLLYFDRSFCECSWYRTLLVFYETQEGNIPTRKASSGEKRKPSLNCTAATVLPTTPRQFSVTQEDHRATAFRKPVWCLRPSPGGRDPDCCLSVSQWATATAATDNIKTL